MLAQFVVESPDPEGTLKVLLELQRLLSNAGGGVDRRRAYFDAIDFAEVQLSQCLTSPFAAGDWIALFHTPRYWEIQRTYRATEQPHEQLNAELATQVRQVGSAVESVRAVASQQALGFQDAVRVVLYTNIHLHFKPFWELKWTSLIGHAEVRLIVPTIVIRELDNKKNAGGKTASRAASRLKHLRALLLDGRGPNEVREGTTVEVPYGFDGLDASNADEAILATAVGLSGRRGQGVRIVTGDYSMELRARSLDLSPFVLDDSFRLPLGDDSE